MANQAPQFQVEVKPRSQPVGAYTYVITRSDDPHWAEWSADSYATREAALAAGQEARERHQQRYASRSPVG